MTTATQTRRWGRRRLALGLAPTPGPGLVLLLVGMVIGPFGLGWLSTATLETLDPVASLALAAVGVLIGLDLRLDGRHEWRLLAAGSLQAGITIGTVAAGCLLAALAAPALFQGGWFLPAMLGICAASSSTVADYDDAPAHSTRASDLDDILPIVLAGLVPMWSRSDEAASFGWLIVQTAVMAMLLAAATVLLVRQTTAESEQRVFIIGAVLLLGGIAAHLFLSALATGLFAGLCWNLAGGVGREHIARDLRYMQHPLTVPLLIVAGARLASAPALPLLLPLYVALRSVGKWLGHQLSRRVASDTAGPAPSPLDITSPGVVGIAIALELTAHGGQPGATTVLSVVVAGAMVFDLLTLLPSRQRRAT